MNVSNVSSVYSPNSDVHLYVAAIVNVISIKFNLQTAHCHAHRLRLGGDVICVHIRCEVYDELYVINSSNIYKWIKQLKSYILADWCVCVCVFLGVWRMRRVMKLVSVSVLSRIWVFKNRFNWNCDGRVILKRIELHCIDWNKWFVFLFVLLRFNLVHFQRNWHGMNEEIVEITFGNSNFSYQMCKNNCSAGTWLKHIKNHDNFLPCSIWQNRKMENWAFFWASSSYFLHIQHSKPFWRHNRYFRFTPKAVWPSKNQIQSIQQKTVPFVSMLDNNKKWHRSFFALSWCN